jgi:hypothetical protein
MLSPYILAALVHERHQTFLVQAETGRLARQARFHRQRGRSRRFGHSPRSAVTGRPAVLRDGSAVLAEGAGE